MTDPQPPAPDDPTDPDQGREWVEFIGKELDREYTRRDTINTRSAASITSATALVTISLAVIAVIRGEHYTVGLPAWKVWLLGAALVCLLTAAIFGILAGATASRFRIASTKDMTRMLSAELWGYHRIDARNETAKLNIKAIRTLRAGNTAKFRFLVLALFAQALGVLLLGAFAVAVIANSPPTPRPASTTVPPTSGGVLTHHTGNQVPRP
ncbi:MAG: hypothetical protein JSS40_16795 [Proteobacteria bacterium]|nr:hypothetical protein [Pseudomonadota bacterium]